MLQFHFCRLVLTCTLFCTIIISSSTATTTTITSDKDTRNQTEQSIQNNTSNGARDLEQPTALPLFGSMKALRYRRQHPTYTIVKHVLRTTKRTKPRRRIKRPKIKYGPPNYNFGEPISYYKPSFSHLDESGGGETIFPTIDHFNGLHIEGSDFELPPSSYEAQSMDLDFYNHKPTSYSYTTKSKPLKHYEEEEFVPETPAYHAPSDYVEQRKPHKIYGLPKEFEQLDDYQPPYESPETLTSINDDFHKSPSYSQHLEQDHYEPSSKNSYHSSSSYDTFSPPATKYGVPVFNHKPKSEYNPTAVLPPAYHTPNFDENPYTLYDKRIPNSGYASGASKPDSYEVPAAPNDHSNIEITYSPSYEINIPENTYGGNFAEPPPEHREHAYVQGVPHAAPPATHATPDYTVEPSTQHHITTGHYQQESESEDSTRYLAPTPGLPLNQQQNRPTYDYPKTSYEVPIYDAAPFDAAHTPERDENYPPHTSKTATNIEPPSQAPSNVHLQERAPFRQRPRKKNRIRATSSTVTTTITANNKHILDVPELAQAFEEDHRQQDIQNTYAAIDSDADVNESNQVEKRHRYGNSRVAFTPTVLTDDTYAGRSHVWDPMRVRTTATTSASTTTTTTAATTAFLGPILSAPTKPTSLINAHNNNVLKRRKQLLSRRPLAGRGPLQFQTDTLEANVRSTLSFGQEVNRTNEPISIISIEKSHSQSYYDGTISPPDVLNSTDTNSANAEVSDNITTKRTTNSIFDTTVFKSPRNNYNFNNNNNK